MQVELREYRWWGNGCRGWGDREGTTKGGGGPMLFNGGITRADSSSLIREREGTLVKWTLTISTPLPSSCGGVTSQITENVSLST